MVSLASPGDTLLFIISLFLVVTAIVMKLARALAPWHIVSVWLSGWPCNLIVLFIVIALVVASGRPHDLSVIIFSTVLFLFSHLLLLPEEVRDARLFTSTLGSGRVRLVVVRLLFLLFHLKLSELHLLILGFAMRFKYLNFLIRKFLTKRC